MNSQIQTFNNLIDLFAHIISIAEKQPSDNDKLMKEFFEWRFKQGIHALSNVTGEQWAGFMLDKFINQN